MGQILFGAARVLVLDPLAVLADAVADEADRVEPAHILLLEEIDGIAVAFGKQRDQHIGAGDNVLAARLDVQDRALDHPLEPGGGRRLGLVLGFQRLVFLIEILAHHFAQFGQLHATSLHHFGGVGVVDQRQQKMLERGIFVMALGRAGEGRVQRLLKRLGETGHRSCFRWLAGGHGPAGIG